MYIGEQSHGKSSTPSPRLAMQANLILVMSIHTSHGSSIDRILQELVTSFRRQQIRRYGQPCSCKKSNSRANSADIPRHVEIPTRNGKLFVMIKQVCLDAVSAICDDDLEGGKRETESATHHNRNNGKLYNRHQGEHACDQRPARFALVFAALHDDQEGD